MPAAGVAEHGQAPLVGQREHVLQRRMVEREALGARVELDPARARRQAALGLGERIVVRVEPAEGHEHASPDASASASTMSLAAG